jgi:tungstate transport system substrate-binding protein
MAKSKNKLTIASTTSTQNSGLFDILIPAYEKFSKYQGKVEVIAVGTGKAIRLAKKGGVDVVFVHDPFREEKFIAEGYGVNRREVMYNEFAIVGPANDPAKVKKAATAVEAFEEIAEKGSPFISPGMIPEPISANWISGMMPASIPRVKAGTWKPGVIWPTP